MNVNEVIANYVNASAGKKLLHPNDDVNMSQSSNDVIPTAMNISAVLQIENRLLPALDGLIETLKKLEKENEGVIKIGRTHYQDATPIAFSQELGGYRSSLENSRLMIVDSLSPLRKSALGGTAVGTGLNSPENFGRLTAEILTDITGSEFVESENKFYSLSSRNALCFAHGAVKSLAADLVKIANDIRLSASGPRAGLGEISIPGNEAGSSIMPGKINPTQCEMIIMVGIQVMANDTAVGYASSQGNFELNVLAPVIIYNFLQSVNLLSDAISSFDLRCVSGIRANTEKMRENLNNSLMLVTALSPIIGYDNSAKVAKFAFNKNISLKSACLELGFLTEKEFDETVKPENMI